MTLAEMMRAKLADLAKKRAEKKAALDQIGDTVQLRGDSTLTEEESTQLTAVLAEIRQLDSDREAAQVRLDELVAEEQRAAVAAAAADRYAPPVGPVIRINTENERTYTRAAERRGISFLRDLINRSEDPSAMGRLSSHMREASMAGEIEQRDVGTTAFVGLTVPQYLTDLVGPSRRAGRPVADIAAAHPLPPEGMTVNISRITTGSTVTEQATETAAVSETNMDDTLLTVDVRTLAGQQDVSRQAIDRGTGIDEIIIADLVSAYNTELDRQIINTSGAAGTHLGIRSTVSIIAVAYTDASPTAAELYPKLADLIQQIQAGVFMGISHFVMHPRRWWWIAKELGSTFPLLQFPATALQTAGSAGGTAYDAMGRNIYGVPVVLDGNIPTTLGAGTNEDVILGVTADELHLWEDPNAPLLIRAEQTAAGNLVVKMVVYAYSAFTAGRYPGAHGTIGGTGLVLPTF